VAVRAALLGLLLSVVVKASSAGDAPPEGADPAETVAAETPAAESVKRYEYTEDLEVTGTGSTLHIATNALVIVTTGLNAVTVELRSATGRQPGDENPAPDKVTVLSGANANTPWDIQPLVANFTFGPWAKGSVNVEGLNEAALREAASVLGQGPVCNSLEPDVAADYRISLESRGRPVTLKGRQENEKNWVDWKVTPKGGLDLGAGGLMIDITFSLPGQDAGTSGMRLAAKAEMKYSSALPGPEDGIQLVTSLTYPKRGGELTYKRTCRLKRILGDVAEGERPKRPRLSATVDLGGKASAWARTATLATLGVQRLAGVREAGLAMWVAQLGIDSLAGAEIPRVADAGARESVTALARLSPDLGPLSTMAASDIGMRNLIRAEAGMSMVGMTAKADGSEAVGTGGVPMFSIAMRRKVRERWRIGAGLDTIWIDTNTQNPETTWFQIAGVARAEYESESGSSNFGLMAGLAKIDYDVGTSGGMASGSFLTTAFGVEWEWWSRGKLGLGVKAMFSGGDGLSVSLVQPSLRWRLGRRKVAVQLYGTMIEASDNMADPAIGGEVSAEGTGGGAGILIRW